MKALSKILFLALSTIALISCLDSEYQSSPQMYVSNAYRSSLAGVQDTIHFGDTIHVGDTVRVPLLLVGQYNILTTFQVSTDKSAFDYRLLGDTTYAHLIAADSKLEEGYLHFNEGCFSFPVVLYYVAKEKGDYQFQFVLASNASEKFSPRSGAVTQPVR